MKILYVILIFTLLGCEKYELRSNPQLNLNGRWDVIKIKVVIDKVNFDSYVKVETKDDGSVDSASISTFLFIGVNKNNELMLTQDYYNTIIDRRFHIDKTKWEFDYRNLTIIEGNKQESMKVDFPCDYCKENTIIETDYMGQKTRYTFNVDTYGAMPSNKLTIMSPTFYTNIFFGGNRYDKAIISHLEITLMRLI